MRWHRHRCVGDDTDAQSNPWRTGDCINVSLVLTLLRCKQLNSATCPGKGDNAGQLRFQSNEKGNIRVHRFPDAFYDNA